jgi:hypothetical protein
MRSDEGPVWTRLRELLRERGVQPSEVVLADLFPADTDMEFGVVLTSDGRDYEFDLVHGRGDLREQAASAVIADWRDGTEWWRDTPHRAEIEAAFRLLEAERPS